MLPVIALVGRPNVGKSTLFNRLTKTRDAIVANVPGLTRDRQYGEGRLGSQPYIVVDTGGIGEQTEHIDNAMTQQAELAIQEASAILFLVDARVGMTPADELIAHQLRQTAKPVIIVLNKIDGVNSDIAQAEFYALGMGEPMPIAAAHGRGVMQLIEHVITHVDSPDIVDDTQDDSLHLAIVGRPNVGKSTLVNRLLGEERVVVFDQPGTTRDSIYIELERRDQHYTLIDTAGVRRRARVNESVEKFSVIKTLQSIKEANVVLLLLDAREGITEQDLHLLGFILDAGKALVIAVNKWDGLSSDDREEVKRELHRRLTFIDFASIHFISALHGSGVGDLFPDIDLAFSSAMRELPTPVLTGILQDAVTAHTPPLVRGRRIKLRYAHAGGKNPPIIVIHGNQTASVPDAYKRYLMNAFRRTLKLKGTPVRIEFKSGDNPYKDKRNTLTPRQERKRKRMIRHYKSKKK